MRCIRPGFVLFILCLVVTACATNTSLDALFYPSESYYIQDADNESAIKLCQVLEDTGYLFDDFSISEVGMEVIYPTGQRKRFAQSQSITPVVVTSINRDYDNIDIFSEQEFVRLQQEARIFCQTYRRLSRELGVELSLGGLFYWDYINGVRGGFHFSSTCEISHSYGWGTGSYANQYEINPEMVCPSGQVGF